MNRRDFFSGSLGLAAAVAAGRLMPARAASSDPGDNFDVVVIGAGLFGSAAARHLTALADGVALIGPPEPADRKAHDGVFASHYDASRLTRIVDPDLVWATLAKRSILRYREIERLSDVDFYHEIGYMMVTPGGLGDDWFDLPAMRKVAADLEVDIEVLDSDALTRRFPYLRFTPGSAAIHQAKEAGYVDPRSFIEAQQTLATAQGATLFRDLADEIRHAGGQVEIRTRSGNRLRANRVLVATGAYTNASALLPGRLVTMVRAAMTMAAEVAPDIGAAYPATLYAKTDGEEDFWGLLMPPVQYPDGQSYIKTMDGYYGPEPLEGFEELGNWNRGNGHEAHHATLQRALREVYPSLETRSTRFEPCLITETPSGYPYIDMIDDRVGLVVGGNGKSAKSSDEIGRIAAAMVHTGNWPSSLPQALFEAQFA